jgi:hypothetical protein
LYYGTQNQVRFLFVATKAKGILELIHSVFGIVHVPSMGKYVYYVSFIENLSNTDIFPSEEI